MLNLHSSVLTAKPWDKYSRDEESGGIGTGLLDTLGDAAEDGKVQVCRAGLLGVGSTNNLGA